MSRQTRCPGTDYDIIDRGPHGERYEYAHGTIMAIMAISGVWWFTSGSPLNIDRTAAAVR